ncbi:MAG: hypothetical protein KU28_00160 [Sulfurovum sp. PC08-66]|nr:MAG: hypothetical protein KU28_00160 [Sulfurovum sp. PC08-66]KIM12386.1 MAG: hypothetical protein KU37_00280 [Sulfuricurvum sp. PC08-66]
MVTQTVCSDATSKALLGSTLFVDKNLSLTRTLACSSCHNPSRAFVDGRYHTMNGTHPVNGALSLGDDGVSLGGRNAPTVLYAQFSPTFAQGNDGNYTGGQFHDGRAATLMHQAKGPFLDTAEMMMPSAGAVIERVKANPSYVSQLKTLYGATVLDSNTTAYDAVADAIATFERNAIFAPFDSKYDRFKEGNYTMSTLEAQGYALFFSNALSCKKCHTINSASEKASHELFTNYAYENIGTPRNLVALQARDGNTSHIDLGLGGRSDINDSRHYGKVKVPTLRNIAITAPYMHNGVFQSLEAVLAFYDHRSAQGSHATNPETNASWESADVNATINRTLLEASAPLSDSDIAALVAFLKLLTDARYESLLD